MILKRILKKIKSYTCRFSNKSFVNYLKDNGIAVGEGTVFRPFSTEIDMTRPSLIKIGRNCYFNKQFVILTHDWVTRVFIYSGRGFLPSSGRVTIGDNVFIGANSVVNKSIPSNSIAVGNPCRVIMSLEEYYDRRKKQCIDEALDYARSIQERFHRKPIVADFKEEFPLFVDGDKIDQYPEIADIIKSQLGPAYDNYLNEHESIYTCFENFLHAAGIK